MYPRGCHWHAADGLVAARAKTRGVINSDRRKHQLAFFTSTVAFVILTSGEKSREGIVSGDGGQTTYGRTIE